MPTRSDAMPAATTPDDAARDRFARMLCEYLEQGRLHQRYQRLRIAVETVELNPALDDARFRLSR